ncbi:hypothetical protein COCSUDRAFT_41669 [Coccomyxa subellipsoidea C-169]|uniref:PFU domain-containing protein n=1 Tax=Coccomyxa subellipsoidea (strain C-169) TaxID=574566 RepID=I0YYF1_COCSC|nr:hypothetical protein COCSUDRAFT_41669 [Coccomyxa subellipsoidea C-169]EIE23420.1 hypothetical protein COCSUDRAFT_41669 [Coccomyxa subellipsoidea C-169]|eukprot:XP_005647964.1 hypothetical protein COCSUDRAFT_41669 [Coccomyxa subellipsoidea C-169]
MHAKEKRQLVLVTTVDIGGGLTDQIELYLGDRPEEIAAAFCKKNGLPDCVVQPLTEHICENYQAAQQEHSQDGVANGGQPQPGQPSRDSLRHSAARSSQSDSALEGMRAELLSSGRSVHSDGALPARRERLEMEARWCAQSEAAESAAASDGFLTAAEYRSAKSGPPSSSGGPFLYEPVEVRARRSTAGGSTPQPRSPGGRSEGSMRSARSVRSGARDGGGRPRPPHERLYGHAREIALKQERRRQARDDEIDARMLSARKGMNYVSAELMRARDAAGYSSYCERLYAEGLEDLEKKKLKTEIRQREAAEAELEEVTWAPQISRMARNMRRPESDTELWSRLAKPAPHKNKERIEEMKREVEEEAAKECTFAPIIDKLSDRMMTQRAIVLKERRISAHEQLYADATRRLQRRVQYEGALPEEFTFAPRILHRAPDSCKVLRGDLNGNGTGRRDSDADLAERLYQRREMAEARKRAAQAAADHPIDPATGRPFFTPAINQSTHLRRRNTQGLPVGDYLYSKWAEYEGRKAALSASMDAERETAASTVKTTGRSGRLADRLRAKRFHQIFSYLDHEGCGVLDLLALAALDEHGLMKTLDAEVAADVEAAARLLARQLQHSRQGLMNGGMDKDDCMTPPPAGQGADDSYALPLVDAHHFLRLMEEVIVRGRGGPRAYLLPSPVADRRRDPDEATFQPSVCSHSKELVARRRAAASVEEPVYEELYREASTIKQRLQRKQAAFQQLQLKECTFRPEQMSAHKAARGRALAMSGLRDDVSADSSSASALTPDPDNHKYMELEREVRATLAASFTTTWDNPVAAATSSDDDISGGADVALRSSATYESLAALQSLAVAGAVAG